MSEEISIIMSCMKQYEDGDDQLLPLPEYTRYSALGRAHQSSIFCSDFAAATKRLMLKRSQEAVEVEAMTRALPLRPTFAGLLSVAAARARVRSHDARMDEMTSSVEHFASRGEEASEEWEACLKEWRAVRAALAGRGISQADRQQLLERYEQLTGLPCEL